MIFLHFTNFAQSLPQIGSLRSFHICTTSRPNFASNKSEKSVVMSNGTNQNGPSLDQQVCIDVTGKI